MNAISNRDDLRKSVAQSLSSPSEDIARHVLAMAGANPNTIEKSITTGTGLVAYDLQAPAKNLYPVNTPLIKSLPRVGGVGTATNWKAVTGLSGSGFDSTGWVPEGQRAGQMSYATASRSAAYATIGEEDQATWEAINAGRTFEDVQATMTMRLLQKMMLKEEMAVLAGSATLQLGAPGALTLSVASTGATLPALTYSVIVVALTLEGYRNSSLAGGVATSRSVSGADGKSFTINGGSSNKSSNATQAVTLGQTLSAIVAPVTGAVAYAWFVGAVGSETLQAITGVNSVVFNAPLASGRQAASAITADCSTNATGFDGLLTTALKPGSGAYVNTLATGTPGVGTTLTASGHGSVNEIDTMLQGLWDQYQVSPTVLWVNSQQLKDIATKVLTGGGAAPLLQYAQRFRTGPAGGSTGRRPAPDRRPLRCDERTQRARTGRGQARRSQHPPSARARSQGVVKLADPPRCRPALGVGGTIIVVGNNAAQHDQGDRKHEAGQGQGHQRIDHVGSDRRRPDVFCAGRCCSKTTIHPCADAWRPWRDRNLPSLTMN